MVPRAEARESQAHRAQYRTSLGGALLTFHVSVHLTNGLPRFGSQVLGFRVKPALCGGLRRTKQPARPTAVRPYRASFSYCVGELLNPMHSSHPLTKGPTCPNIPPNNKNTSSPKHTTTDPKLNPLARALGVQRNGCDFETSLFHAALRPLHSAN